MFSYHEDAFRTYGNNAVAKILNCAVNGTRSGMALAGTPDHTQVYITGCRFRNITRRAIQGPSNTTIRNCEAGFRYGPALLLGAWGDHIENADAKVTLLPSETPESVTKQQYSYEVIPHANPWPWVAAGISGEGHRVVLKQDAEDLGKPEAPIVVGFQKFAQEPARDITLINRTDQPVILRDSAKNCVVVSNGNVKDRGQNNTVKQLTDAELQLIHQAETSDGGDGNADDATPKLIKMLESGGRGDKYLATQVLGSIGPAAEEAVPALVNTLETADLWGLQLSAAEALGEIGAHQEKIIPILLDFAEGKPSYKKRKIQFVLNTMKKQNRAPVALDSEAVCREGEDTQIALEYRKRDDTQLVLETAIDRKPQHGKLEKTGRGSYTYSCPRGVTGTDTFRWKISDGRTSTTAEVRVHVKPERTPPELKKVAILPHNRLRVSFTEPLRESAADVRHYKLHPDGTVKTATLTKKRSNVVLEISGLETNKTYTLTAAGIRDTAETANVLKKSTYDFRYIPKHTGLRFEYYHPWEKTDVRKGDVDGATPLTSGTVKVPTSQPKQHSEHYAFKYTGQIDIPEQGEYTFYTTSDDGSRLYIDGTEVVDNGGAHGKKTASGTIQLEPGLHAFTLTFFQGGGGSHLEVSVEGPGFDRQAIPAEVFFHEAATSGEK